jgi:dTDP-4-amino-4,6-dideoxygalactose transaminase
VSRLALLGGRPITKNLIAQSNLRFRPDLERRYLLETHKSGYWDNWPGLNSMAARFAREWKSFNKSSFCILVTNGTHSLQLALEALDIGPGDEVIVPGLTWQATASAVCDVNAVPVLVDIDEHTLCISPKRIEEAITSRTRAIIPVHLYHRMADMDVIRKIARKHSLHIIEDCAHAHGSIWKDKAAGTMGDFGTYSFQRSKLMNSGEGGALLIQDEELYHRAESLRVCGREVNGKIKLNGKNYKTKSFERNGGTRVHSGNFRLTSFQAAVLRGQLAAFRNNASRIDRNGLALDNAVEDAPGVKPLKRSAKITRQCGYGFAFIYDRNHYDGLDAALFREALSAELGATFGTTYTPLSHSEVYYPHTKKRHNLSRSYVKSINPARFQLPVADDVWENKAVVSLWQIFSCPPKRAKLLTDAIAKIYDNRDTLLKKQRRQRR